MADRKFKSDPCKASDEDHDQDSDAGNSSEEEINEEILLRQRKWNESRRQASAYKPEPESKSTIKNFFLKRVLPGAVVGAVAVLAAPVALAAVGFSAGGIVGGSMAASMMSSAAIANGGGVAAGSLVAVLQSAGAAGISAAANAGIFTAVSTATAGVVEAGSQIQNALQEEEVSDKLKRNNNQYM